MELWNSQDFRSARNRMVTQAAEPVALLDDEMKRIEGRSLPVAEILAACLNNDELDKCERRLIGLTFATFVAGLPIERVTREILIEVYAEFAANPQTELEREIATLGRESPALVGNFETDLAIIEALGELSEDNLKRLRMLLFITTTAVRHAFTC